MSEYSHVEKPFLDQLAALDWTVIEQSCATCMCGKSSEGVMRISVPVWKVDHDA